MVRKGIFRYCSLLIVVTAISMVFAASAFSRDYVPPVIWTGYAENVTANSASIEHWFDQQEVSSGVFVEYGTSSKKLDASEAAKVYVINRDRFYSDYEEDVNEYISTETKVEISNLQPGTTYFYRSCRSDLGPKKQCGKVETFTTDPEE